MLALKTLPPQVQTAKNMFSDLLLKNIDERHKQILFATLLCLLGAAAFLSVQALVSPTAPAPRNPYAHLFIDPKRFENLANTAVPGSTQWRSLLGTVIVPKQAPPAPRGTLKDAVYDAWVFFYASMQCAGLFALASLLFLFICYPNAAASVRAPATPAAGTVIFAALDDAKQREHDKHVQRQQAAAATPRKGI
eukprot:m.171625 g.171625  ORF g.171625 m.171625 type:complete len:193 (-) comp15286_c1_seq1:176-754(-)